MEYIVTTVLENKQKYYFVNAENEEQVGLSLAELIKPNERIMEIADAELKDNCDFYTIFFYGNYPFNTRTVIDVAQTKEEALGITEALNNTQVVRGTFRAEGVNYLV